MGYMDNNFKIDIKTRRENMNLSKKELSNITGIARSSIADIENGKRVLGALILYKLSIALKCSMEDLIKIG